MTFAPPDEWLMQRVHIFCSTSSWDMRCVRRRCAGQEEFFLEIGKIVERRRSLAPHLSAEEQKSFIEKAKALAPKYRTESLGPQLAQWCHHRASGPWCDSARRAARLVRVAQHRTIRSSIIINDAAIQIAIPCGHVDDVG
jgi:hypothetical protein